MRLSFLALAGAALGLAIGPSLADGAPQAPVAVAPSALPSLAGPAFTGPRIVPPPAPPVLRYDRDWLEARPAAAGGREWTCLTEALYFEARGEPVKGQFAVAEVILNRVDAGNYPDSVCAVVHQGSSKGCQFSFTCDGRPETIRERAAYVAAGKVARLMLDGAPRRLTDGATHFHTRAVRPGWARRFARTAEIGQHLFYRASGNT